MGLILTQISNKRNLLDKAELLCGRRSEIGLATTTCPPGAGPVNTGAFHLVHPWGKEPASGPYRLSEKGNNLILHKLVTLAVYFDRNAKSAEIIGRFQQVPSMREVAFLITSHQDPKFDIIPKYIEKT